MSNLQDAFKYVRGVETIKQEYRLYYDESGGVLFYTMVPEEGDYILVDKETYAKCRYDIRVVNGKIENITGSIGKLTRTLDGTGTHLTDITLIDPESSVKWKYKDYE